MQSFYPCVAAAAAAATETYISVARERIVSVSSPLPLSVCPQLYVSVPQYSALPPASLRAGR